MATILASAAHVAACNKVGRDLKTGHRAKAHSLSGLRLPVLGVKKANKGARSTNRGPVAAFR